MKNRALNTIHNCYPCFFKQKFLLALLFFYCGLQTAIADVDKITDTRSQLKQLEGKIRFLEKSLHSVHNKQETLHQELEHSKVEIDNTVKQLKHIENDMQSKRQQIQFLNQLTNTLNHQLKDQQTLLAKHIRSRYKVGDTQLMLWPLNQKKPEDVSRTLAFYRYLMKARQQTIHQVVETQSRLQQNQRQLNQETMKLRELEQQVKLHQHQLELNKRYQAALLKKLNEDIQGKQETMRDYQQNKDNLSQLINSLAQKSFTRNPLPLLQKKQKLPNPIPKGSRFFEKMNQGILFLANEGTPIQAVQSGKVVFSDWLKGYGQLLILDHGAGLMTLYAYNQALLKHKGDYVEQGEKIATVGHTGAIQKTGLYFEIRIGGKAVSPIGWLY